MEWLVPAQQKQRGLMVRDTKQSGPQVVIIAVYLRTGSDKSKKYETFCHTACLLNTKAIALQNSSLCFVRIKMPDVNQLSIHKGKAKEHFKRFAKLCITELSTFITGHLFPCICFAY